MVAPHLQNSTGTSLSPQVLNDFAGQESVLREIEGMVKEVSQSGVVLRHLLLTGPGGVGKATLAQIVANEAGVNVRHVNGGEIETLGYLAGLLTGLESGDILFVDDIQRLLPESVECLCLAMEKFQLEITIDGEPQPRVLKLQLPTFALIGSTPRADLVSPSLVSHFWKTLSLDYYSVEELEKIVRRSAGILEVAIDPLAIRDIASRSGGTPHVANSLLRRAVPRLRMLDAISRSAWGEIPNLIASELWELAEERPDFEDLPIWIPQFEAATNSGGGFQRATAAAERGRTMLRSLAEQYSDEADSRALAQIEAEAFQSPDNTSLEEFATFLADGIHQAKVFRKGVSRLPIAIDSNRVVVGRHTRISFNRTLRIPEDGKEYPLPAGFGRLPVLRVEDYAHRIPKSWLEQGGFIIPLYQREALFVEFSGAKWRPTIAKVAVGKVNAVSGKEYDLKIRSHRQDYVVIPEQRWLDGINSGDGTVSQFVAMPLGQGYTIEGQVTDEEIHGGFQLAVFEPKPQRFPDQDPEKQRTAEEDRRKRSSQAAEREILKKKQEETVRKRRAQQHLLDRLPAASAAVVDAVKKQHYRNAAHALGITEEEVLARLEAIRSQFVHALGDGGFDGVVPKEHLRKLKAPGSLARTGEAPRFMPNSARTGEALSFMPADVKFMPAEPRPSAPQFARQQRKADKVEPPLEMGIARGGTLKQQIFEDTYGAESWDESTFRDVVIHIVNSDVYHQITGREAPPSPISIEHYQRSKIPWYSAYEEKAPSLSPAGVFKHILAVGRIDRNRGVVKAEDGSKRDIQPERIVRIHTPTLDQRFRSIMDRAVKSSVDGRHRIAAREASLAIDLSDNHQLPFLIRAVSNHHLGHPADAETDASACLALQPDNVTALHVRALSLLALGETLLAKNDAETILASQPDHRDGLYIRAQANLQLAQYRKALADAQNILRNDPVNHHALRIKAEALTKIGDGKEADKNEQQLADVPPTDRKGAKRGSELTVLTPLSLSLLSVPLDSASTVTQLTPADLVVNVSAPARKRSTVSKAALLFYGACVMTLVITALGSYSGEAPRHLFQFIEKTAAELSTFRSPSLAPSVSRPPLQHSQPYLTPRPDLYVDSGSVPKHFALPSSSPSINTTSPSSASAPSETKEAHHGHAAPHPDEIITDVTLIRARLAKNKERLVHLATWARKGVGKNEIITYKTMLSQALDEKAWLERQASGISISEAQPSVKESLPTATPYVAIRPEESRRSRSITSARKVAEAEVEAINLFKSYGLKDDVLKFITREGGLTVLPYSDKLLPDGLTTQTEWFRKNFLQNQHLSENQRRNIRARMRNIEELWKQQNGGAER